MNRRSRLVSKCRRKWTKTISRTLFTHVVGWWQFVNGGFNTIGATGEMLRPESLKRPLRNANDVGLFVGGCSTGTSLWKALWGGKYSGLHIMLKPVYNQSGIRLPPYTKSRGHRRSSSGLRMEIQGEILKMWRRTKNAHKNIFLMFYCKKN